MTQTKITFSFDFELGWGYLENNAWRARESKGVYRQARSVVPETLALLADLHIPTTWALVGGMLYERPDDIPLAHLPSGYKLSVMRFLETAETESWQALDFANELKRYPDVVEVASHTLTHPYALCEGMTAESYVEDVRIGLEKVESFFDTSVVSHVFTRDQSQFRDALASWRPMNTRLNPAFFNPPQSALVRRLRGAYRLISPPPQSRCYLGRRGESYQSGSVYFNWADADFSGIKRWILQNDIRRILNQAGRDERHFHIWLHPYNLCESLEVRRAFENFVRELSVAQDRGDCVVQTMSQRGYIDRDLWQQQGGLTG